MRKKFLASLLLFSMVSFTAIRDANAIVGLLIKKQNVKTIGAIASGTGSAIFVGTLATAIYTSTSQAAYGYIIVGAIMGPVISGLGLVVLDDTNRLEIDFQAINTNDLDYKRFKLEEIQMYNSELEELNAIKNTIEYESNSNNENVLWKEYSSILHPFTIKIAQDKALRLLNAIQ